MKCRPSAWWLLGLCWALTIQLYGANPTLPVALDAPDLPWVTGGDMDWYGQTQVTHDGVDAARSGWIDDDTESWLETSVRGPGTLSFWWKVSSEAGWDRLRFEVNGLEVTGISGEVDWQPASCRLPAGQFALRWVYAKDSSNAEGQDAGWVDQVRYQADGAPPTIQQQPTSQVVLEGDTVTFRVTAQGAAPLAYQWYYSDFPLAGASSNVLTLVNVSANQAGEYWVEVSNPYGTATSDHVSLAVGRRGPNLVDRFDPNLNASVWAGFAGPVVAAGFGGSVSGTNALWLGHYGSRWALTKALDTRQGGFISFYLRLMYWHGDIWRWQAPPDEGVVLECTLDQGANWTILARFDSSAYYQWTRFHMELPPEARGSAAQFRWRQPFIFNPEGGEAWALDDVEITVWSDVPRILEQPRSQRAPEGTTVSFEARILGTPAPVCQWWFNGALLASATSRTLTLSNVTAQMAGAYQVTVGNALAVVTSDTAQLTVRPREADYFQVLELSREGLQTLDHWALAGSEWGGLATSTGRVFTAAGTATASFRLGDLGDGRLTGRVYETLACNLANGALYTLGCGGAILGNGPAPCSSLIELDGETGQPTGRVTPLSMSLNLKTGQYIGLFSGYNRLVIHDAIRVYDIELDTGRVTDCGPMAKPSHRATTSWAYYGVAEFDGVSLWLVLVDTISSISRVRVPDGQSELMFWGGMGAIAPITASVFSGRWYCHWEAGSEFGYGSQMIASARARFAMGPTSPVVMQAPTNALAIAGATTTLSVRAFGTAPLTCQWWFAGAPLAGATNLTLTLSNTLPSQAGTYWAVVSNRYGSIPSASATLDVVVPIPPRFDSARSGLRPEGFELVFTGQAGLTYEVQASWYLNDWGTIGIVTATSGPVSFVDNFALWTPWRFYRLRLVQ